MNSCWLPRLSFQSWCLRDTTIGIHSQENREINGCLRPILEHRPVMLPEAAFKAPLNAAQHTLRYTVSGPCAVGLASRVGRGQVGEILKANALTLGAMARRTGEIVRTDEKVVHLLP